MAHGSSLYVSLCTGAGGMASVRARSRSEARGAARGWGPTGEAQEAISLRCGSFDVTFRNGRATVARGVIFEMPIPISFKHQGSSPPNDPVLSTGVDGKWTGRSEDVLSEHQLDPYRPQASAQPHKN